MAQLIYLIKNKLASFKRYQFKISYIINTTILFALGMTAILGLYDIKQYEREKYNEFHEITARFQRVVNIYLESYIVLSHSTRAIFSLTRDIDLNDWKLFCNNIYLESRYPGMVDINYFQYMPRDKIKNFTKVEKQLNNRTLPVPSTLHSDYALLIYNLTITKHGFKGFGDDLFAHYNFRDKLIDFRDPNETLITQTYQHDDGLKFFIFTPVYYKESDFRTIKLAENEFLGWIGVTIDVNAFFRKLLSISADYRKVGMKVYEIRDDGTKQQIFSTAQGAPVIFNKVSVDRNYNRAWELQFSGRPEGYYIFNQFVPATFFILIGIGLVVTLITVMLIWSLTTTKQRAIKLAEQISYDFKRAELQHRRLVQNVSGVIFMCDPRVNWKMVYISDQFLEVTGYPADDFINNKKRCFTDIIYPADIHQIEQQVHFKPIMGHKYFQEYRIVHADGSVKWVHERSQVVHDMMTGDIYLTGSFFDMTEQKRKEQEFRVLTNALKNAVGGIAFIGKDLRHVHANYAYAQIFDVPPEKLVNASLLNYINQKDHQLIEQALNKIDTDANKITLNVEGLSDIKKTFYLNIVFVAAFQEALPHRLLGYYCFVRDTSTDVLREHALSEAVKSAEAANKTKSKFLASMSHELRTPLNAIIGYSDMIQEELTDSQSPNTIILSDLNRINDAGKHLLTLINDVLDVSKLEAGRMTVYLETFNIRDVCISITDIMIPLAHKKNNQINLECSEDIGTMHSDLTKVRQSLFNLCSNACKFTTDGTITVRINNQTINDHDFILFSVIDTGIGIQSAHIDKLFQPFVQADSSTTRDYGGTGLGLTITKRFSELLGGNCTVTSVYGQGTTFTLLLPRTAQVDPALLN